MAVGVAHALGPGYLQRAGVRLGPHVAREGLGDDEGVAVDLAALREDHGAPLVERVVPAERLAQVPQASLGEVRVELDARGGLVDEARRDAPVEERVERRDLRPGLALGGVALAGEVGDARLAFAQARAKGLRGKPAAEGRERRRQQALRDREERRRDLVRRRRAHDVRREREARDDGHQDEGPVRQAEAVATSRLAGDGRFQVANGGDGAGVGGKVDAGLRDEAVEERGGVLRVLVAELVAESG